MVFAGYLSGCEIEPTEGYTTILDADQAPLAERGGVATDNRFFLASGNQILELLPQPDGTQQTEVIYEREECTISGMAVAGSKIYAACTALNNAMKINGQTTGLPVWSDLVRIDLLQAPNDPGHIAETRLADGELFANGMAVDNKGDIYITNTFGAVFKMFKLFPEDALSAVIRVRITDEDAFSISKTTVVPVALGGLTPNGIQIKGDRLWFVSVNVLYEAKIAEEGLVDLKKVYQTKMLRMFDDFAILPGNAVAITEFDIIGTFMSMLFPNAEPSGASPQLTFVSTGPGPGAFRAGKVTREHLLPDFIPSSATVVNDAEGPALYVTSYFNGGLYRVDLEE